MNRNRELYNHLAGSYNLRQQNPSTLLLRKKEQKLMEKHSYGLVLDLGCGTGHHLDYNENIAGLDISEKMLSIAKNKNKPLIQATTEGLPIKKSSIDTVLCFYTTLNLVDFDKSITEISAVLKIGGKILLSVTSIHDGEGNQNIKNFRLEGKRVKMQLFKKDELVKSFTKYGFSLIEFDSVFRIQKPRWGNFQKFSMIGKIKLGIERIFPKEKGRIYLMVFEKI